MRNRIAGFMLCCLAGTACATLHAADYKPPEKVEALNAVRAFVAEAAKSGEKLEMLLDILGENRKTLLVSADEQRLVVKVMGNDFDQHWEKLPAAQVAIAGRACLQKNGRRALALADYCFAAGDNRRADDALTLAAQFDSTLGEELRARMKYLEGGGATASTEDKESASGAPAGAATKPKVSAWGPSIVDANGKIVRDAYIREALDWSPPAVHLRFGPDYDFYHKDKKEKEEVPTIYQPPEQFFKPARNGQGMPWTVGGPPKPDGGDYSSTHAQLFYLPEKTGDPGVDRIGILDMAHNVFNFKPEPTWWGGSHPEPGTKNFAQAAGGKLGAPVAMARGYGIWCNSAVMVFSSGLVGCAGTCTSQNTYPTFQFPKGKVPTGVALTSRNEFALITIWDVENLKGQLAVLSIDSMHKDGLMGLYSFHEPRPGLPNVGGVVTMKLLGYIDLPNMAAPTALCAYGNGWDQWLHSPEGKNAQPCELDLNDPKIRALFYDKKQWNYRWASDAGFVVIVSKHENKMAFVDLQPLFAYYREMYFGAEENVKKTKEQGVDGKQWPFSFEVEPKQMPVVTAVMPTPAPTPTSVICSVSDDDPNVLVGFQDGKVGVFKVGALATAAPAGPNDIRCTDAVTVGRNPCALAYNKNCGWGTPATLNNTFLVVSRGDRMIQWVQVKGTKGEVIRTLKDSRLLDPVHCETADTHGTESHVVTVCDFKGKKVINYRFGPVVFHTNGGARFPMGPDGKAEFECGGTKEFPGFPYRICGTNVN